MPKHTYFQVEWDGVTFLGQQCNVWFGWTWFPLNCSAVMHQLWPCTDAAQSVLFLGNKQWIFFFKQFCMMHWKRTRGGEGKALPRGTMPH